MKTTFNLPDPLLRKAKAVAAEQGRPLRELVVDALEEKLLAMAANDTKTRGRTTEWTAFSARLQQLPDGSWVNRLGIDDDAFFDGLEAIRAERNDWEPENVLCES